MIDEEVYNKLEDKIIMMIFNKNNKFHLYYLSLI